MQNRRRIALASTLVLLLVASGCSGSSDPGSSPTTDASAATTEQADTGTTTVDEEFTGDDFYAAPDPIPTDPHGTLVRYETMDDYVVEGATTYRIMYTSESVQGDPIVVTGMASVPTDEAPAEGRPMLTISHGTTGIADECAPSKDPQGTEMTLARAKLGDTFLIAATDDEGLGTPGRHPYLVGESEGRSAIDAIVAAGSLPDAEPGTKLAVAGYSQGGHGALWTSQVAAEWAPDLEVVGVFSGAPASEIGVIVAAAQNVGGFAAMVIAGIAAAYPEADLSEVLTPTGIEVLDAVDTGCAPDTFKAVGEHEGEDIFVADGGNSGTWNELANAQNAGQEKTNDAPTLIIHSNGDGTVPTFFIDQVTGRMCDNGQVVERRDIDGGGHGEAAIPAYDQALPWLEARFETDGQPAVVDTCE